MQPQNDSIQYSWLWISVLNWLCEWSMFPTDGRMLIGLVGRRSWGYLQEGNIKSPKNCIITKELLIILGRAFFECINSDQWSTHCLSMNGHENVLRVGGQQQQLLDETCLSIISVDRDYLLQQLGSISSLLLPHMMIKPGYTRKVVGIICWNLGDKSPFVVTTLLGMWYVFVKQGTYAEPESWNRYELFRKAKWWNP